MIARRRITDITEQIAGGLPAAFSAMRTAAGNAASRFPRPAAVSAAAVLLVAVLVGRGLLDRGASAGVGAGRATGVRAGHATRAGAGHATGSGAALALLRRRVPVRHRPGAVELPGPARRDDQHRRGQAPGDRSGSPRRDAVLQRRRPDGADRELRDGGFGELPAAITARYDIITFDPRGFGYSTAVRCFPTMAAEGKFLGGLFVPAACPSSLSAPGRTRPGNGPGPGSTRGAPSATAACSTMTPPPMWPVT